MNEIKTKTQSCTDVAREFLGLGCEISVLNTGSLPSRSDVWLTSLDGFGDPLPVRNIGVRSPGLIALRVVEDLYRVGFGPLTDVPAFKVLGALDGLRFQVGNELAFFVFSLNRKYPDFHQGLENTERFLGGLLAGASTVVESGVPVYGAVLAKSGRLEPVTRHGALTCISEHPEVESLLISARRLYASKHPV